MNRSRSLNYGFFFWVTLKPTKLKVAIVNTFYCAMGSCHHRLGHIKEASEKAIEKQETANHMNAIVVLTTQNERQHC